MDMNAMMQMLSGGAGGSMGGARAGAGAGAGPGDMGSDPAGMRHMEAMLEAMTNGDPELKKQMEGYWKMLDNMAQSKPEEYDKYIKEQMTEMKAHDAEEQKTEELKWSIQSEPYFAFSILPAKILDHSKTSAEPSQDSGGIRLFDFGQTEEIKESFSANRETTQPLDGPKLYLNIVHSDRVLPPLNAQKAFADPDNDRSWLSIPICFTVPIKRRNMSNIECWHFDAHVNTCVVNKMKQSQDRFRAVWNYLIMRFQNHVKNQFVFHKQSIKLAKKKKYKDPIGNSQTVRKYIIAKEFEKEYYRSQRAKIESRQRQAQAQATPKDVNIGDILAGKAASQQNSNDEELKELNLPGGKTTAKAAASSGIQIRPTQAAAAESVPRPAQSETSAAAPTKPLVVEMKDRPGVEVDYDSDPNSVKLVITVEKENSAKNLDLDVAEKELRLESENYELKYKFQNGVQVDPDSVAAKFSKRNHTLTLTLTKK